MPILPKEGSGRDGEEAVLAAGGVLYAFLVGRDLTEPRTWRRARREVGDPRALSELPEVNDLRDPTLMRAARQLWSAQAELQRERKGDKAMLAYLDLALGSTRQLDDGAARLINRGDELFRYLRSQDPDRLRSQIKDLGKQIERAGDEAAREQYAAAKAARVSGEGSRACTSLNSAGSQPPPSATAPVLHSAERSSTLRRGRVSSLR